MDLDKIKIHLDFAVFVASKWNNATDTYRNILASQLEDSARTFCPSFGKEENKVVEKLEESKSEPEEKVKAVSRRRRKVVHNEEEEVE